MDTIIPYTSNHPTEHKYAAVRFLEKEYQQELNVIQNILYNNSFPIKPQKWTIHTKTQQQMTKPTKCKWAMFTYVGKEMSDITNVYRRADLKIAFWTNNTIGNLLGHRNPIPESSHCWECTS